MKKATATVTLAAFWLFTTHMVHAGLGSDPRAWLERMSAAMSQMDYQGTFVYMLGDQLETMRITHVSGESGIRERLVSLSGSKREILRDSNGVRWVLGDIGAVLSDHAFQRPFFPELPTDRQGQADPYYTLKFGGETRIAGHTARNIKVQPRDHYRYGYSLWLEKHSGLLLKWELVNSNRKPLAKLMFTDLRLGSEVDQGELKTSGNLQKFKTIESGLPTGEPGSSNSPRWRPAKLPPGFTLSTHQYHTTGNGSGSEYEHLVYSDGLAAVSVYVESLVDGSGHPDLTHKRGTTHAYTCTSGKVTVTVVGNVPAATVELIGKSVELASN
jgi:sigma-E factor negative regulatory protein RseB